MICNGIHQQSNITSSYNANTSTMHMLIVMLFARVFVTFGISALVGDVCLGFVLTNNCLPMKDNYGMHQTNLNYRQKNVFAGIDPRKNWNRKNKYILMRGISEDDNAENGKEGVEGNDESTEGRGMKEDDCGHCNDNDQIGGAHGLFKEDESTTTVDFGDLVWRVEKLRLEEANTRRFLKSGPRFLPYTECRNWVKAWNRWATEEEWLIWINEGEKRNSYIPTRPDEYYGNLGQWRGWDHFLGKVDNADEEKNGKENETS